MSEPLGLFQSGIRPLVDEHIAKLAEERRDYGKYFSASSAGYCMRRNIFEKLQVPYTTDKVDEARKQRIFSAGHVFHEWIQGITKEAGISIAQEHELISDKLLVKGHFDDLVKLDGRVMLIDYKSQNSKAFTWQKNRPMSYFHTMQLATYIYMLREGDYPQLNEARIVKISKDDLRLSEQQLLWSDELRDEVLQYWRGMNKAWEQYQADGTLPPCTCHVHEGGFLAKPAYNSFYFDNEPCSIKWFEQNDPGSR